MSQYNNSQNTLNRNRNVTTTSTSYTALQIDDIIEVTSTAAPRTITLPTATSTGVNTNIGKVYVIKDTSGGAGTNNITITPTSGTIDGVASVAITTNYGSMFVCSDGVAWYSQASNYVTGTPLAIAGFNGVFNAATGVATVNQGVAGYTTIGNAASRLTFSSLTQNIANKITQV